MRFLAAALVVLGLMACDMIGDLGLISEKAARGWAATNTAGLLLFVVLIVTADRRDGDDR